MSKNECAKTVTVENAYETWVAGDYVWKVLKKYQSPENEAKNPYARWFTACKSPNTFGMWEYGDEYVTNITRYARRVL